MTALNERELADPLSPSTRAERKFLLLTNLILFAVVWGRLVPKEFVVSGFKVSEIDVHALVLMLEAVAVYALAGFLISSRADLSAWRVLRNRQAEAQQDAGDSAPASLPSIDDEGHLVVREDDSKRAVRQAEHMYDIRGFFEFWLPVVVGVVNPIACAVRELWPR